MSATENEPKQTSTETAPPDDPAAAEAERIAALELELAETKDRLMRTLAESENARRRAERERDDTAKYAVAKFAGALLSVADNLRRAVEAAPPEAREAAPTLGNLAAGVEATERELLAAFERAGIQPIEAAGLIFDPHWHEVMIEVESDQPAGTVVAVYQTGWKIHDRLLRPARVAVARSGDRAHAVNQTA